MSGASSSWSAAERRKTQQAHLWFGTITVVLVLLAGAGVAVGNTGVAVCAGAGALLGALNLLTRRKHGVWGLAATVKRSRVAGIVAMTIGLALLGIAALFALDGQLGPALGYGVAAGVPFLFGAAAFSTARIVRDAEAAVAPEPVSAVCPELRGLRGRSDLGALVATPTRIARVQASAGVTSETGSIPLRDITGVEASLTRGRASLLIRRADGELAVHRAAPPQVHAVLQSLRRAGVPELDEFY
jgi:hypothetical protein